MKLIDRNGAITQGDTQIIPCNGLDDGVACCLPAAYGCKVAVNGFLNRDDGFAGMCLIYERTENFL